MCFCVCTICVILNVCVIKVYYRDVLQLISNLSKVDVEKKKSLQLSTVMAYHQMALIFHTANISSVSH